MEDVTLDPFSDDVSFRLGGRALDALLEIFTYNDFAVRRFLAGYKFCLLEHFRRSPLPSLLCTQERISCSSVSILLHFCRLSLPSLSKSAKTA